MGGGYSGAIDLLTGGFPCQPYSTAGKRLGKDDARHLWPENYRAIREIRPRWVVGENVRGLTNWNGGLVFDEVQSDLEAAGYKVLPFLLPAAGIQAPHERSRIWFIAHCYGDGCLRNQKVSESDAGKSSQGLDEKYELGALAGGRTFANAYSERLPVGIRGELESIYRPDGAYSRSQFTRIHTAPDWNEFPAQSPICGGDDGIPDRMDRIAALGNAVVPKLVLQIFKAIDQYEKLSQCPTLSP